MPSRLLSSIALLSVALPAVNIAITQISGTREHIAQQLVRLLFACVLAYYLKNGRNWARWTTAILMGMGGVGFIILAARIHDQNALPPVRIVWSLIYGLAGAAISIVLIFSKKIARECAREAPIKSRIST